jgi:hypothetical protein
MFKSPSESGISDELIIRYFHNFFYAGTMRVIRDWLENGCQETPEELARIILVFLPASVPPETEKQTGHE